MNIWRVFLVCTGLVSIAALSSLGLANDVYADIFVLDAASCLLLPGGGTSWDVPTSTCTKSSGGHMTFIAGDTLTVPSGTTLKFTVGNRDLRNDGGTITNNGIITFTTNRDLRNDAAITNNGMITFTLGGDINNRNFGTFTNSGVIDLDSSLGGTGRLTNRDDAIFTNTNTGSITLDGSSGPNNNRAQLRNLDDADFTNSGTITMDGTSNNSGQLRNRNDADFTNSGTITISGTSNNSGQLRNQVDAVFTNSGTITISGTSNNSGQLRNQNNAILTNSVTITVTGTNDDSGELRNQNNGLIVNNCGTITFVSFSGNPIQEGTCPILISSGTSSAYEDPTIGKSHNGKQIVENGICIDINCWTVTADYHQDFKLVEMLSDSTHTITTTVFCQNGVNKCNYVAFGVSPYDTNINDSVWKIILQKDHLDNWTMKIIDPDGYLGEVTSTTQIVNDNRYLSASATIEFKKPTTGMILNIEVRDSGGGYRDFKFNDGIEILDAYAYPLIETSYESPLEIESLCLNENPNKRYTCAFDKVRDWTIKNAEAKLQQITNK